MIYGLAPGHLGDVFNMASSSDTSLDCGLFHLGIFRPECWAAAYEKAQYGFIPRVTTTPIPAAPQTQQQMTVPGAWTPDDGIGTSISTQGTQIREKNQAAIDSRDWVPSGKLPFTADDLANYELPSSSLLLIAGAVVVGVVVLLAMKK